MGFYDVVMNDVGDVLVNALVNDAAILGITDNVLMLLQPQGGGVVTETALAKRGDILPGQTSPIHEISEVPYGIALNDAGQTLYLARLQSGKYVIYLDQTLIAEDGGFSPIFGTTWSLFGAKPVALNDQGDYAFGGRTSTGAEMIVWNGTMVAQTGDSLEAIEPFEIDDLGLGMSTKAGAPLHLDADGRILWYAGWDDPAGTSNAGLFLDHELILQKGVTHVGGVRVAELNVTTLERPVFDMSETTGRVAFVAELEDGRTGAFLLATKGGAVAMPDCGGNLGVLTTTVTPSLGGALGFNLGNAQAAGVDGFVALATKAAAGWPPCGLPLPGAGELMLDLTPPNPFLIQPGLFSVFTDFTVVTVAIPDELSLLGQQLYAQGVFVDFAGVAPAEPLRLTGGLDVTIGL